MPLGLGAMPALSWCEEVFLGGIQINIIIVCGGGAAAERDDRGSARARAQQGGSRRKDWRCGAGCILAWLMRGFL